MDAPARIALRREPGAFTRSLTVLILRLALGGIFLFAGLGKFQKMKTGEYPKMITEPFGTKIVMAGDVALFAKVLPYAEVGVGAALIGGALTTLSAFASGALLLLLLFGQIHTNNIAKYPEMLSYILVNSAILWLSPVTSNYLSVDGLLFGLFWRPRPEGEYHREDAPAGRPRRI
jgi:uncharacterized membrane protein YphA (DoxX/SURF4 family)